MTKIIRIKAREVLDSRGNPTIEATVYTKRCCASAIVPSGASTGKHEALELRDNQKRYLGLGVKQAVRNVSLISKRLIGCNVSDQENIDQLMIELDGTKNKSRLGANAILAVSLAAARTASLVKKQPLYRYLGRSNLLPIPFMNIINGGKHADNRLCFQEFMVVPVANSFSESLRLGSETYHVLKQIIHKKYGACSTNVGDEGGFAPKLSRAEQALDLIMKAIKKLGYETKIKIAIDAAASEFYKNSKYLVEGRHLNANALMKKYLNLIERYPIISIEDPFSQDDFKSFAEFTEQAKIQVVGDDLLVTNVDRIKMASKFKACNALLLKVNQIGTLTEAMQAAKLAFKNKWNVMVSHRSGETEDSFIADLAVGLGTGQIKSGAPCRTERVAKYNRLLRIEEELGSRARFNKTLG